MDIRGGMTCVRKSCVLLQPVFVVLRSAMSLSRVAKSFGFVRRNWKPGFFFFFFDCDIFQLKKKYCVNEIEHVQLNSFQSLNRH